MLRRVCLIFLAAGLGVSAAAQPRTVVIGPMTELTGTYAANGADCKRGYGLARETLIKNDRIGGYQLSFSFGDTRGDAKSAVSEFRKMLDADGVWVALANRSQVVMALNPIARQRQVPFLGIVGYPAFITDSPIAFRYWPNSTLEGAAIARKAIELGYKSMGIVSWEDEWTISVRDAFAGEYRRLGGKVLMDEMFGELQTDFSSIIARLRAIKPEAIFVNLGINNAGVFIGKLRDQGLKQQLFGSYYTRKQEVIDSAGKAAIEGLIFEEVSLDGVRFNSELKMIFGDTVRPTAITYTCYTALAAVFQALKNSAGIKGPSDLAAALGALKSVELLDEPLKVVDRQAQYELEFKTIRNGQIEALPATRLTVGPETH
jgi:ABC-type branched-subunit amino acid transport system substrate-binding protein